MTDDNIMGFEKLKEENERLTRKNDTLIQHNIHLIKTIERYVQEMADDKKV